MIRGKFGQAKCGNCHSWHFAVQLDENMNPIEYKCCKCGTITEHNPLIRVKQGEKK